MKTAIILFCVFGIALCVPVTKLEPQPTAELPSPIPAATTGQVEVARRRRQLFGLDYNVYNNNGFGYFGKPNPINNRWLQVNFSRCKMKFTP